MGPLLGIARGLVVAFAAGTGLAFHVEFNGGGLAGMQPHELIAVAVGTGLSLLTLAVLVAAAQVEEALKKVKP